MSLFFLFCFIQNKKTRKFHYVYPLAYLRQKFLQSYFWNLQINALHLHKQGN